MHDSMLIEACSCEECACRRESRLIHNTMLEAILETAHEVAKVHAFPEWPWTPAEREDLYWLLRDTAEAWLNGVLFDDE